MSIASGRSFPAYRFSGTHREIGRQFGEATRDLIWQHRDLATARLGAQSGVGAAQALAAAWRYRPFVQQHAPFLDEEIAGVAEGAGLSLEEAYLLQLRAELANTAGLYDEIGDECTTFAVLAEQTRNGQPLIGQNADLPAFYRGLGVVIEIVSDDHPPVLMLTPAGQVSYIGINGNGLGVFANFLTCDGWRMGFPRYLLSRLALIHDTVDAAIAAIDGVPRASSRNMLLLDAAGSAADLETTPTQSARLRPGLGFIAHANHYVAPSLLGEERYAAGPRENSCIREGRMIELLAVNRGHLDATLMQAILRDRATAPDTLSRAPEDDPTRDVITFASVIAEPAQGQMWVAVGPPHEHSYRCYGFTG
jgi:isopenicillin-N N-acyltransferase-like protein